MEDRINLLNKKITEYDLLYKQWCRKIDLVIKNIAYKLVDYDKKILDIEENQNKIIEKTEIKLQKYKKVILFLVKKIKNSNIKTPDKSKESYYLLGLKSIIFFIIIYYINATIIQRFI